MNKPFRPAHWSRVTATIAARFNLDWQSSKRAYDALRARNESTPTLKLVTSLDRLPVWARRAAEPERFIKLAIDRAKRNLPKVEKEYRRATGKRQAPDRKPGSKRQAPPPEPQAPPKRSRSRKPAPVEAAPPQQSRMRLKPSTGPVAPGSKLQHAPQTIPPVPAPINPRLKPHNTFERLLQKNGLPIQIGRGFVGKEFVALWQDKETLGKLTRQMGIGYRQIERNGGMSEKVKSRVWGLIESLYPDGSQLEIRGRYQAILRACYGKGKGK